MYDIVSTIYGIPYTQEMNDLVEDSEEDWGGDYFNLEEYGFEFMYSGYADLTPGFLGLLLDDQNVFEMEYRSNPHIVTEEMEEAVRDKISKLPQAIRDIAPEPKVQYITHTS